MLIRQSENSFIRIYEEWGFAYITNQLTLLDRVYNETGAVFLAHISRCPQDMEKIIKCLGKIYGDIHSDEIRQDFMAFAYDLAANGFVVIGESREELNTLDQLFSYNAGTPKTMKADFSQSTADDVEENTMTFLLRHDFQHPRLASLQIELTSRCNERCVHCYIPDSWKDNGGDMSLEQFKAIVDQYAAMGGLSIGLSGGEALLNRHFAEMLRHCREKDLKISVLSNLALLTDETARAIKEANVSLVQVSLYSMDPEIHDKVTKIKGSFQKTKAAIERLHELDVPLLISCPIMKINRHGYTEVVEYARSLRIQAQTDFILMAEAGGRCANLANRLSLDETEELLRELIESDRMDDLNPAEEHPFATAGPDDEEDMPMCGAGINDLSISAKGDVFPCSGWQGYKVGNVFDNPLKEIWDSSPRLLAIRSIRRKDFRQCDVCTAKEYCNMCLVRNFNESNGDMFKVAEHFCKVAKLTKRLVDKN